MELVCTGCAATIYRGESAVRVSCIYGVQIL